MTKPTRISLDALAAENKERIDNREGLDHKDLGYLRAIVDVSAVPAELVKRTDNGYHVIFVEGDDLRSLVVTEEGAVLSSDFPRVYAYGEDEHVDSRYRFELQRGNIEFTEKRDGATIIVDVSGTEARLRRRDSDVIGRLDGAVRALIDSTYPRLWEFLADPTERAFLQQHSLQFEYTGPDSDSIIPYDAPELTFLGYVNKGTLKPGWDRFTMERISRRTGVPQARVVLFRNRAPEAVAEAVAGWQGVEGVVARTRGGEPLMVKLQSEAFLSRLALQDLLDESEE